MARDDENRRTDSIRVRLSSEMMDRFEKLAQRYGMPPATLCAFAVARFVQQEENNLQLSRMAVMDVARKQGEEIAGLFNDESLERILGPVLEGIAREQALQQKSLPLDGEASKGA